MFVLTDGDVSNSEECAKLVRRHNNNNRVFTLGLGAAADRHLVKGLARAGRGTAAFTSNNEDISAKVMIMMMMMLVMMMIMMMMMMILSLCPGDQAAEGRAAAVRV